MAYGDTSNYYGNVVRKLHRARSNYGRSKGRKSKSGKINLGREHPMGRSHIRSASRDTIGMGPAFEAGARMGQAYRNSGTFGSKTYRDMFARP